MYYLLIGFLVSVVFNIVLYIKKINIENDLYYEKECRKVDVSFLENDLKSVIKSKNIVNKTCAIYRRKYFELKNNNKKC